MKLSKAIISFIQLNAKAKKETVAIILIYFKVSCLVNCFSLNKYYHKYFQRSIEEPVDLGLYKKEIQLIRKVIKQLPGKQTCLKESIVVHLFFKRKGITIPIYLGVSIKKDFSAHAWYDKNGSIGYVEL